MEGSRRFLHEAGQSVPIREINILKIEIDPVQIIVLRRLDEILNGSFPPGLASQKISRNFRIKIGVGHEGPDLIPLGMGFVHIASRRIGFRRRRYPPRRIGDRKPTGRNHSDTGNRGLLRQIDFLIKKILPNETYGPRFFISLRRISLR